MRTREEVSKEERNPQNGRRYKADCWSVVNTTEEVDTQVFSAEGKKYYRHQVREGASGGGAEIRIMWKPVGGPVRPTFHPLLAWEARQVSFPLLSLQKVREVGKYVISGTQKSVKPGRVSSYTPWKWNHAVKVNKAGCLSKKTPAPFHT